MSEKENARLIGFLFVFCRISFNVSGGSRIHIATGQPGLQHCRIEYGGRLYAHYVAIKPNNSAWLPTLSEPTLCSLTMLDAFWSDALFGPVHVAGGMGGLHGGDQTKLCGPLVVIGAGNLRMLDVVSAAEFIDLFYGRVIRERHALDARSCGIHGFNAGVDHRFDRHRSALLAVVAISFLPHLPGCWHGLQ